MRIIFNLLYLTVIGLLLVHVTEAQEIAKTVTDYSSGPITYSPSDPVTRSKVFKAHTGHGGLFYGCDGEECNRYSPYICWKTQREKSLLRCQGLWQGWKTDLAEVRQRVSDGAGACKSKVCQLANQPRQFHPIKRLASLLPAKDLPTVKKLLPANSQLLTGKWLPSGERLQSLKLLPIQQSEVVVAKQPTTEHSKIQTETLVELVAERKYGLMSQHPVTQRSQVAQVQIADAAPTRVATNDTIQQSATADAGPLGGTNSLDSHITTVDEDIPGPPPMDAAPLGSSPKLDSHIMAVDHDFAEPPRPLPRSTGSGAQNTIAR